MLNGTEITSEERRGAELDYLKYHGREYLNSLLETTGRPHPEFLAVHPRYLRLVESESFFFVKCDCLYLERKEYANWEFKSCA